MTGWLRAQFVGGVVNKDRELTTKGADLIAIARAVFARGKFCQVCPSLDRFVLCAAEVFAEAKGINTLRTSLGAISPTASAYVIPEA